MGKFKRTKRTQNTATQESFEPERSFADVKIPDNLTGLSQSEANQKMANGEGNKNEKNLLKSNRQIIRENTFTLFNLVNVILAGLVFAVGSPKNSLFIVIIAINSMIGIFQEIKAKNTIEKLSLIAQTKATVLREGKLLVIPQDEIVLGECLFLENGDQVAVDGRILFSTSLEVDESLLTGEAERIVKKSGDQLFSGSFVTAGQCFYKAEAVGSQSYAAKLANEARTDRRPTSQLLNGLQRMIRVLTFVMIPIGLGLFYAQLQNSHSIQQAVLGAVAALISMIPEGLMLLTSVAFAVGAANLAKKRVLVQSMPGIETLARVDVICLDKTGTITDGTLKFEKQVLLGKQDEAALFSIMSELMAALPDSNGTAKALRQAFSSPLGSWAAETVIPFSSARKWSGVTFAEQGSFVVGAPEFIYEEVPEVVGQQLEPYLNQGYRGLVLVRYEEALTETLPQTPEAIALLLISDNLRENAIETFSYFKKQGVMLKVISGDHPLTVSKIAEKAGIPNAEAYVDMSQIAETADFEELVKSNTVFGRVSPYQKRKLLRALKADNHITCMTGDGVNDVLALREADIGVAMANGSNAARAAADVILLESDFAAMKDVLNEGRRVINNIERVASMYLVKTIYSVCLAVIFMLIATPYPFEPLQLAPVNSLTVGIPSFFLALKPSYQQIKGAFLNNILRISVPGAITVVFCILVIQLAGSSFDLTFLDTSTMSVLLTGCVGLQVLVRVSQPLDQKKKILVGVLAGAFFGCFLLLGDFFGYGNLINRNIFFYLPLFLGIRAIFNYMSLMMNYLVYLKDNWQKKRRYKHG